MLARACGCQHALPHQLYELTTPPRVRFSATLGEESEIEVALVYAVSATPEY